MKRKTLRLTLVERAERYPHWTCGTHGDFDARVVVGCPECVRDLRAERDALQELLRQARLRLNTYMSVRQTTHWEGCWTAHNDCKLLCDIDAALAAGEKP